MVRTSKMTNHNHLNWQVRADGSMPLYLQLEDCIKQEIRAGYWKPGDRIASERELMQIARVSRATVRQTLSSLVQQGILDRKHGRGTFVTRPKFEQPVQVAFSFSDQIRALGLAMHDQILKQEVIQTPPDLAKEYGLPANEPVIHLLRLRLLEDVPLMVNQSYIVHRFCPDLLDNRLDGSLYRLLTEKYQLPLLRSTDVLEAAPADGMIARYLAIPRGEPIMSTARLAYTRDDALLHVGLTYIRGDMCRFRVDLQQPAQLELKA